MFICVLTVFQALHVGFSPRWRNQPLQASSLCTDAPPLPQKKIGRKSLFSRFFSEEGGTSHRLQASCWGKWQKRETKQQGSGKGQPILPLSFLCLVPCHLLVISILLTPGESMSTGFSTSKQEYGDPHFLNYNFMTSASFQWKPNWQNLCSGFF